MDSQPPMKPSKHVTEARAAAQRAKLDAQAEARRLAAQQPPKQKHARAKREPTDPLAKRRAATTLARAIEDYLNDHEGGNHSLKTLQWHQTSLGLLRRFLEEEREITLIGEVDAPDISAWFAHLRKTPGSYGKPRTERTVQTYARSARAFFHWLVRRETIDRNPFERVVFPKVGKPLIRTIEPKNSSDCCWPVHRREKWGSWPIAPRPATGPCSGCSMTPAFAWLNCAICIWGTLTASTARSWSRAKAPRSGASHLVRIACATCSITWIATVPTRMN
jgi:hypothetical protein